MPNRTKFLQFPLSLLAYGDCDSQKVKAIIAMGVVKAGMGFVGRRQDYEVKGFVDDLQWEFDLPEYFDSMDGFHRNLLIGLWHLGVVFDANDFTGYHDEFQQAHAFCENMALSYGAAPQVRVRVDFALDAGRSISYREFFTICGLYAALGNKKHSRVTRDRIRAAAMGYKSNRMLFSENSSISPAGVSLLAQRADRMQPQTVNQIRTTLDSLEEKQFFARVQPSRRHVYFSNRLTRDQLGAALFSMRATRTSSVLRANRQSDRELQARIRAARSENGTNPTSSGYSPTFGAWQ